MKSYTDLEQSHKLAEILPLESADMRYAPFGDTHPWVWDDNLLEKGAIPCWSLAALLGILNESKICHYDDRYYCQYISEGGEFPIYSTSAYNNPVDACCEMIEKLHELKKL